MKDKDSESMYKKKEIKRYCTDYLNIHPVFNDIIGWNEQSMLILPFLWLKLNSY